MTRVVRGIWAALLLPLLLWSSGRHPAACGPFLPNALFVRDRHPDVPFTAFATGTVGVLPTTYARSYLAVAYRQFSGVTTTPEEARALVGLWSARLGVPLPDAPVPASASTAGSRYFVGTTPWETARKDIAGLPPAARVSTYAEVPGKEFVYYDDVLADALETASETLRDRQTQYGADGRWLREWVIAQDAVFAIGSVSVDATAAAAADTGAAPTRTPTLPALLPADSPALARADRAYQRAAFQFYARQFQPARDAFLAIAQDASSPWRAIAPYLAARCLIRAASLAPAASPEVDRQYAQAVEDLRAVAASQAPESLRASARGLIDYVRLRRAALPESKQTDLTLGTVSASFLKPQRQALVGADLEQLTWLLDMSAQTTPATPAAREMPDLVQWLRTFQSEQAGDSEGAAVAAWRAQSSSLPWLVAALTHVRPGNAAVDDLLRAAALVPSSSPAFTTLTFHRARLSIERGDLAGARAMLDPLLTSPSASAVPRSAFNALSALRLRTARSLEEFLQDAAQPTIVLSDGLSANIGSDLETGATVPTGITREPDRWPTYPGRDAGMRLLTPDSRPQVNRLPLADLIASSTSTALPAPVRQDITVAAFTRAVLLKDVEHTRVTARALQSMYPALSGDLATVVDATSAEAQTVAAIWLILRNPGFSPYVPEGLGRFSLITNRDPLRDNWWCRGDGEMRLSLPADRPESDLWPAYLDEAARTRVRAQLDGIRDSAGEFLGRETLAWADRAPADPRIPQALHLVVQTTRYRACGGDGAGKWSQAAYRRLHQKYPASEWAKRTRYWYQ